MNIMTNQEKTKLVQKQLDAYNNKDIDSFCECFHSEIQVTGLNESKSINGIRDFRSIYSSLFSMNPKLKCEIKTRIILSEAVIDHEYITNSNKKPIPYEVIAIYSFKNNLIDKVWFAY